MRRILIIALGLLALTGPATAGVSAGPARPATAGVSADYSSPLFCAQLGSGSGTQCINARNNGTRGGTTVQLWSHTRGGNDGSWFRFVRYYWVTTGPLPGRWYPWPYPQRGWDEAWRNYAVGNLERVNPANGVFTGRCVTSLGLPERHTTNGSPFWGPIRLGYCSSTRADRFHSFLVWNRRGSIGHAIEIVTLSRYTNQIQHLGCLYYSPQPTCEAGDPTIFAPGEIPPRWAHWNRAVKVNAPPAVKPDPSGATHIR